MNIGDRFNPHGLFNGIFIPDCICSLNTISWSAKACWGKLKEYAGKNGLCFPKQSFLAVNLGLAESTVRRALQELIDQKFIEREKPEGHKKLLHHNYSYYFLWHECMGLVVRTAQNERSEDTHVEQSNIKGTYIKDPCVEGSPNGEPFGFSTRPATSPTDSSARVIRRRKSSLSPIPSTPPSDTTQSSLSPESKSDIKNKETSSLSPESKSDIKNKETVTPLVPSPQVQEVFDYWTECGLHMPKVGTKSYNKCVKQVRGLFGGGSLGVKYDINQIKTAIDHFSFAALDPDFEPANLTLKKSFAKMIISEFIYCPFRRNGDSSMFKKYIETPPKALPNKLITDDKHPKLTEALLRFYKDDVLGGATIKIPPEYINCFRMASQKVREFYEKNKNQFNRYMPVNDQKLALWLWESIKADCYDDVSRVSPQWFISNSTHTRRFPAYLYRQNILEEKDNRHRGCDIEVAHD